MTPTNRRAVLSGLAGGGLMAASSTSSLLAQDRDQQIGEIAGKLADGGHGQVLRPGQAGHDKVRYYNARFDCVRGTTYLRPATTEGVRRIVEWANAHRRTFAIRAGGHSFEGKSSHPDIVIDLSQMRSIALEADGTLKVGAGALLGDIYKKTVPAGWVIPAGTCPSVGVGGHVLGGGIGDFLPIFGYAAQSLRAVTLVTFTGSVLNIDDERIEVVTGSALPGVTAKDVMTVLRGAGQGMLGVVTEMTLAAHDLRGAKFATFTLSGAEGLATEDAVSLLSAWQAWRMGSPQATHSMISSKVNYGKQGDRSGIEIQGLVVVPKGAARGGIGQARRALDPLFGLRYWRNRKFAMVDAWGAIASFLDDDDTTSNPRRRMLYGSSSVLPAPLNQAALEHLVRNVPSGLYVSLYTAGGRAKTGPATSLHPAEFLIEWVGWANRLNPELYPRIRSVNLETMRKAGFEPNAFPNYCDPGPREYFPNKARIEEMRAQFDPAKLSTSSLLANGAGADTTCR